MEFLAVLGIIAGIGVIALYIWAAKKEAQLIGYYKEAKLFGRLYAFFAVDFLFTGILMPIAMIIAAIAGIVEKEEFPSAGELIFTVIIMLIMSLIIGAIGFYMYYRVAKKVPDYMRKRVLTDLTICGFGLMCRFGLFVCMFFFKTWWEFAKPEEYTLEKTGQTVMVFPDGNVYDSMNSRFGKLTDDGNAVIWN